MNKGVFAAAALLLTAVAGAQPPEPNLARAQKLANGGCVLCHGAEGESSSELFPKLAAQNSAYLAKQLANFKSGTRKSSTMEPMVKDLTEVDFVSLSAYFAAKPATAHAPTDVELVAVGRYVYAKGNRWSGVAACAACHGPDAAGTAALPRLAGQQALYIENQIKQFNKRERTNDNEVMHAVAAKMTELEVKAVAEYLAAKR